MRGVGVLAAAAVLLCAALAGAGTTSCPGDCDRDGEVGIDDLVAAVGAALGGPLQADCTADLDGNGTVAVNELVHLVGLALAGCAVPLDAAQVAGVYDVEARSPIDPSGGYNRSGVAALEPAPGGLVGHLYFSLLESYGIELVALPDGTIDLSGGGVTGGDIAVAVTGNGRLTQHAGVVELRGHLGFDLGLGAAHLDAVFQRPATGTPPAFGGTYRLALQHPTAEPSAIELPVDVPPSGFATCGAAEDRGSAGVLLAALAETACVVSPSGRFRYVVAYDGPALDDLPLQLWGTLAAAPGVVTRGMYFIAAFPAIAESGAWQAEHLAP